MYVNTVLDVPGPMTTHVDRSFLVFPMSHSISSSRHAPQDGLWLSHLIFRLRQASQALRALFLGYAILPGSLFRLGGEAGSGGSRLPFGLGPSVVGKEG
jgi:hypothetical protein